MGASNNLDIGQCLSQAAGRLRPEDGRHVAEILLCHALQRDRAWLFAHARDLLEPDARERFNTLIERRTAGEPVAYLIGHRGFWTLDLEVNGATLIPRPETERLVELALERLADQRRLDVADLGTGSGAIALAIASERPRARVVATDASEAALVMARSNAARHDLDNVEFRAGSWFVPLNQESFDLIASNPPYIAQADPHLRQGDLRHEPLTALASGADGLDDIRHLVAGASPHLKPGGWLLLEHGLDQGEAIRALFAEAGFVDIATEQDLEHRDRVSLGRRPG